MRVAAILIVGVGLALVAGCGGDEEGGRRDGGSRPDAPALAGPLVYERSGGLAGDKSQIRLEPDGQATFATVRIALQPGGRGEYALERTGERTVKLRPAELAEVERELARVDLAELPAKTVPAEPIPDTFGQEVTYQGETVYTEDGADEPDELGALTGRLSALFGEYATSGGR